MQALFLDENSSTPESTSISSFPNSGVSYCSVIERFMARECPREPFVKIRLNAITFIHFIVGSLLKLNLERYIYLL